MITIGVTGTENLHQHAQVNFYKLGLYLRAAVSYALQAHYKHHQRKVQTLIGKEGLTVERFYLYSITPNGISYGKVIFDSATV